MKAPILFAHLDAIPARQIIEAHGVLDDALIHGKKKL